jgi:hypothetical protein
MLEDSKRDLKVAALELHLLDLLAGLDGLQIGGDNLRLPVVALREDGIEIFVNARGEHHPPMFFVIGGKIGATTGKTDSDRRSDNKHKELSVQASAS